MLGGKVESGLDRCIEVMKWVWNRMLGSGYVLVACCVEVVGNVRG